MATLVAHHERLAERDEILFPHTNLIDTEPFYENFTSINRPLNYQTINGHIFNLIRIAEEIGSHPQLPWINSLRPKNRTNELFYLILQLGGAYGPLASVRRVRLNQHYFQRWYLEKCSRSASLNRSVRVIEKRTTQISDDHQSALHTRLTINTPKQMDEKHFQNGVLRMYGFDDLETNSSHSSRRSSIDELESTTNGQTTPTPSKMIEQPKGKQQITIREYYPRKDIQSVMVDRSLSSSEQTLESEESNHQEIDDENDYYEQMISNDPELFFDPNPQIITKENPEQVTYKQNVSVRYLLPPTPPPPGPLIIREILPPRAPTPPPLVIQQQDPTPPTPPPLVLREAPPIPPAHQEPEIITKMLPPQAPPARQVIMEQTPPLPPKPQSIIIEKWLPYKQPPPREIIYERVVEPPVISQFQVDDAIINQQQQQQQQEQSARFRSQSFSRLAIPVHIERQSSVDNLHVKQTSAFEQFARFTQQQLQNMQAHQQWIANQHHQHMNIVQHLTTPTLVVYHPPVTKIATASYAKREEFVYQPILMPSTYT